MNVFAIVWKRKKSLLLIVAVYVVCVNLLYVDQAKNAMKNLRKSLARTYVGGQLRSIWRLGQHGDNDYDRGIGGDVGNRSRTTVIDELGLVVHIDAERNPVRSIERLSSRPRRTDDDGVRVIAVGGGITSRRVRGINATNIASKMHFFLTFLPSFCRTATADGSFVYWFYLGYDRGDPVFDNDAMSAAFRRTFSDVAGRLCGKLGGSKIRLELVRCNYGGSPTWAQNDAMLAAYMDGADFFYRVNDDTVMRTPGWARAFVDVLTAYQPPMVGVVGPRHSGGNTAILTYDFVHRTHVEVFGFYYPREFTDWWGDRWITTVYPANRSTKLSRIRLVHTMKLGQRYTTHRATGKRLGPQLTRGRATVARYTRAVREAKDAATDDAAGGRRVIAMSLYGNNPRYTWGAIRNAQLVPVFFPGWRLRVYVADDGNNFSSNSSSNSSDTALPPHHQQQLQHLAVPRRVINTLRALGAQIARVELLANNTSATSKNASTGNGILPARDWRLLAADDAQLDYFLVRDADARLSDRDAAAVKDWIDEVETSFFDDGQSGSVHCIRDHPRHANMSLVGGLWGGRPTALRRRLGGVRLTSLAVANGNNVTSSSRDDYAWLWRLVSGVALCHDSVSPCGRWSPESNRLRFPVKRMSADDYLGQRFDGTERLVAGKKLTFTDVECTTVSW